MLKLASESLSQRAIARQALGNARLHGRVERILRKEQDNEVRRPSEAPRADGELPTSEELFTRYLRDLDRRLEEGERVSAQEIAAIIRVEHMLESKRMFERARDLTLLISDKSRKASAETKNREPAGPMDAVGSAP